jgi:hypothetical protein
MANLNDNLREAIKGVGTQFNVNAYNLAALMTINDNLAEINETLKDIKHTLRMMDRNAHGSDY